MSKLCSFCKRFRGRVIIFGDGKGMKSKGATANIREARISHARITDFSSGKSRYTIFARKLVGQLSTLPIIIAVRSKIHESEEISPPTFQQASKIRYTPFPFSILFFFFRWCFHGGSIVCAKKLFWLELDTFLFRYLLFRSILRQSARSRHQTIPL